MLRRTALALTLLLATAATAAETWQVEPVGKPKAGLFAQTLKPAPSGIPGMLTAVGDEKSGIRRAWYSLPTTRYRHGALGDNIEGGALVVERADGRNFTFRLGESEVFEDLHPRIADLDGDGEAEIVTIRSSVTAGASIAIYGLNGDALIEKAAPPYIGQANRWLNIAGIDHFLGRKGLDIAFVVTPHIGGRLGFASYDGRRLSILSAGDDFSNHVNRTTELRLSAVADVDGDGRPDLALPSADRKRLRIVAMSSSGLTELGTAELPAAISKAIVASGTGAETMFTVGLDNGKVYEVKGPD